MGEKGMTKDQAIQQGYAEQIEAVDKVDCDFSGRQMQEDGVIEFTAHHKFDGADGIEYCITAYYYQDDADMPEDGDLGSLDWVVAKYEIA